ncbi:sugar porter family MFS transporter [Alteromonas ponticola]
MNAQTMNNDAESNPGYRRTILRNTIVVALAGLLFGYDTGVIGGSQLYFTEYFQLSPGQQGWAVSSAIWGCLFGAMIAGILTKGISRKYTLILSGFLFSISAWGSGVADSLDMLVIYRIIGGVGVGIASMAAPMYIAEISPPKERGRMVSLYQLAIVTGFFVVFLSTYFIGGGNTEGLSPENIAQLHHHNVEQGWRIMLWSELLPALAFFILLFFVPHSPRWLMMKGREDEARVVLRKLTETADDAESELNDIRISLSDTSRHHRPSLLTRNMLFVLFLGVMLSVFQQVTGINAILYYGAEIFSNALGYGPEDALKQQLWLGAVNFAFTFVAIFTVDRWGRKPLLITGTLGMLLGLMTLGLTIYTGQMGVISLIAILTFIGSFALSMGPVVWVMLSEIFPNSVRSVAMSIAVAAQWLFNAIVANSFPLVNGSQLNNEQFNGALPYFIFAGFCVLTIFFVWRFIPETKGLTLEEMENVWVKNKKSSS